MIDAMNRDSGMTLMSLKVDGGMTANNLLMQLQADLIGIDVGMYVRGFRYFYIVVSVAPVYACVGFGTVSG